MCGRNIKTVSTNIENAIHATAKPNLRPPGVVNREGLGPRQSTCAVRQSSQPTQTLDDKTVSGKEWGIFVPQKVSLFRLDSGGLVFPTIWILHRSAQRRQPCVSGVRNAFVQ